MMEICRGQHGLGDYHLLQQYQNLAPQPIPDQTVYSPEEIVQHVKGRHHDVPETSSEKKQPVVSDRPLSQTERAHRLIQEKKIIYDSGLHTFTVLGSQDKPQAVKLFPAPTCTCPSTSQCYHILAAKMYLGMEDTVKKTKLNLTQLLRNACKRKEKKSGRKDPRVGDCEVHPAPDAKTMASAGVYTAQGCRHLFAWKDSEMHAYSIWVKGTISIIMLQITGSDDDDFDGTVPTTTAPSPPTTAPLLSLLLSGRTSNILIAIQVLFFTQCHLGMSRLLEEILLHLQFLSCLPQLQVTRVRWCWQLPTSR